MVRARSGRRRHHPDADTDDARDLDPPPPPPARRRCLLMAATPATATGWRLVTKCDTHEAAIQLADLANTWCIVIDVRTWDRVYDNRKAFR
jgi:hypothetical protein